MKLYSPIKTAPQLKAFVEGGGKIGVTPDGALYVFEDGAAKRITPVQASEILEQPIEFIQEIIDSIGACELPIVEEVSETIEEKTPKQEVVQQEQSEGEGSPKNEGQESDQNEDKPEPDRFEEFEKHLENLDEKFKMLNEDIQKLKDENAKLAEEVKSLRL